jgi:hypothetical protein
MTLKNALNNALSTALNTAPNTAVRRAPFAFDVFVRSMSAPVEDRA